MTLLWANIRGRDNGDIRVNEEQRQDLAVSGTGWIGELERADTVLVDVREEQSATTASKDLADVLNRAVTLLDSKNTFDHIKLALLVAKFSHHILFVRSGTETEVAVG